MGEVKTCNICAVYHECIFASSAFHFLVTEFAITICSVQPDTLFQTNCDELTTTNPVIMSLLLSSVPPPGALHSASAAEEAKAGRS